MPMSPAIVAEELAACLRAGTPLQVTRDRVSLLREAIIYRVTSHLNNGGPLRQYLTMEVEVTMLQRCRSGYLDFAALRQKYRGGGPECRA